MGSSQDPNAAIDEIVTGLMSIAPSERDEYAATLRAHDDGALGLGQSAAVALQSAFVATCTSAAVAAIGL